ncbi:substrate-binding domain-containing protein [Formosa sp. S-31]|uniref:substrate-binding domain-containing protein n=1 Tax=Formosa sp. S-31 TaxID=2790949 RepID=UPI003EC14093
MINVNIGGVPEHFNLPWYIALKNGDFKNQNINLRWHDYFGGTGEMCEGLRTNQIDLAVILTEGIVTDIIAGNPATIVQTFVETPLNWGIHVAEQSKYKSVNELKGQKAAISRYGSGSHLMAYINAQNHNWNLESDLKFEVIKDLDGAVESLTNGESDYFMWEKYTTKPLVDSGVFRNIGNCPSPWPCFVIAVRTKFLEENRNIVTSILEIINGVTMQFKSLPNIEQLIASRYQQKLEDVKAWLAQTEWSQELISQTELNEVQNQLLALNIITEQKAYNDLTTKI